VIPEELAVEYEALRRGVGAHRWHRDVVSVSGPDAAAYLQGQCSQDLAPLTVGASVPSLLLEPDGKLTALLRVTRTGEAEFILDTDDGYAGAVVDRLTRFRLRTKAEITVVDWPCVALRGSGVAAALAGSGVPGAPWALSVEWNGMAGVDLLGPGADEAVPADALWCSAPSWDALRVEAGIPAMGSELDGRTIAAEAGLVERTVSFTKGCYTGQELVARLDARGSRVARRLCGIIPDGGTDMVPGDLADAELHPEMGSAGPATAGSVTSVAWSPGLGGVIGIGYVHRSVALGDRVTWNPVHGDGGGSARVVALPMV
jgi:tRNA-modifying protein YgfZ